MQENVHIIHSNFLSEEMRMEKMFLEVLWALPFCLICELTQLKD